MGARWLKYYCIIIYHYQNLEPLYAIVHRYTVNASACNDHTGNNNSNNNNMMSTTTISVAKNFIKYQYLTIY